MVTDAVLDPAAGGQDQPADSRGVTQGVADGGRGPQREADQGGLLELPVVHQVGQGLFLAGLIGAPAVWALFAQLPPVEINAGYPALIVAGLLVGIGTRYASGCTSGHGVCGLSRLSLRSLVATLSFMATGFITVFVIRHLIGA